MTCLEAKYSYRDGARMPTRDARSRRFSPPRPSSRTRSQAVSRISACVASRRSARLSLLGISTIDRNMRLIRPDVKHPIALPAPRQPVPATPLTPFTLPSAVMSSPRWRTICSASCRRTLHRSRPDDHDRRNRHDWDRSPPGEPGQLPGPRGSPRDAGAHPGPRCSDAVMSACGRWLCHMAKVCEPAGSK